MTNNTFKKVLMKIKSSIDQKINKAETKAYIESAVGYVSKNLFDFQTWVSNITSIHNGTFVTEDESITITATATDAWTEPHGSSAGTFRINVFPNTKYILSWRSDKKIDGRVYVFLNGNTTAQKVANNNSSNKVGYRIYNQFSTCQWYTVVI